MINMDAALRSADRAAAAPFLQTPRIPAWYPFAMATYFTAVFGAFLLLRDGRVVPGAVLLLLAVAAVLAQATLTRARWGTWPRLSEAPAEIRRAFALYVLLAVAAIIASVGVWSWVGAAGGLAAVFLTALAVVWAYEFRLYPAAARQVRQRLA
ncbi:hypothetical protein [Georgenia faecalis]|uniref:Transmembrane protein n=1 Tax=Georgenia faecalis TaxID=2483799 RepID=A0ABV9DAW0_9MICO|nr:hypothetical protein [Georgenia faecalis]